MIETNNFKTGHLVVSELHCHCPRVAFFPTMHDHILFHCCIYILFAFYNRVWQKSTEVSRLQTAHWMEMFCVYLEYLFRIKVVVATAKTKVFHLSSSDGQQMKLLEIFWQIIRSLQAHNISLPPCFGFEILAIDLNLLFLEWPLSLYHPNFTLKKKVGSQKSNLVLF